MEGVQCERCHGPSEAHLRRLTPDAEARRADHRGTVRLLRTVPPHLVADRLNGPRGILNVRFQPYRLANSKCYDAADARIRCTACHDPHRDLETAAAAYDAKCTACHSRHCTPRRARSHRQDCVTCHMPRIDLPGAHRNFTDHQIRIVRAGEAYPD